VSRIVASSALSGVLAFIIQSTAGAILESYGLSPWWSVPCSIIIAIATVMAMR